MLTGPELGAALAAAIEKKGVSKASVAQFFGVKPPSVQDWIRRGTIAKERLVGLWAFFSDTVGPEHWGLQQFPNFPTEATENVTPVQTYAAVPLISWIQAGAFGDLSDPLPPADVDDWMPCPVKHGKRAYCLKVRGESMLNPDGRPSYSEGDVIFVDPDAESKHGDRVIVRLDDEQQATFKQLVEEGGHRYLKALNPAWNPRYIEISGNATICGKVIGKWTPE